MAMGKPVIATDIGATPELIEDGQSGLLVSPGDARELAAAVERLLSDEDLRHSLAEAGRHATCNDLSLRRFFKKSQWLSINRVLSPRGLKPCLEFFSIGVNDGYFGNYRARSLIRAGIESDFFRPKL